MTPVTPGRTALVSRSFPEETSANGPGDARTNSAREPLASRGNERIDRGDAQRRQVRDAIAFPGRDLNCDEPVNNAPAPSVVQLYVDLAVSVSSRPR